MDKTLCVTDSGPSAKKLIPEILNSNFQNTFKFKRPSLGISYSYESIKSYSNQVFILQSTFNGRIVLRGEFQEIQDNLIFIGSPWLLKIEDLDSFNLTVSDFAVNDPVTDLLQVLSMRENDITELK